MPPAPPVVFWLLLAATLCVDAVATFWIFDSNFGEESATLFLALAYGELSALCAWAVFARERMGWRWLLPILGAVAAGLAAGAAEKRGRSFRSEELLAFIGLFVPHVIAAFAVLWMLKSRRRSWRFSIANLFVLMTVLAVLIPLFGRNQLLQGAIVAVVTLVIGNIVLLATAIGTRYYQFPIIMRLAFDCAVAILVGSLWLVFGLGFATDLNVIVLYLIQMLTLSVWLAFVPVPAQSSAAS
jgi:hypothetical protein